MHFLLFAVLSLQTIGRVLHLSANKARKSKNRLNVQSQKCYKNNTKQIIFVHFHFNLYCHSSHDTEGQLSSTMKINRIEVVSFLVDPIIFTNIDDLVFLCLNQWTKYNGLNYISINIILIFLTFFAYILFLKHQKTIGTTLTQ